MSVCYDHCDYSISIIYLYDVMVVDSVDHIPTVLRMKDFKKSICSVVIRTQ